MNTEGTIMFDTLDRQCVDTLRFLSVDMVQKANSGHPGLPLGAAPMAYALWTKQLTPHARRRGHDRAIRPKAGQCGRHGHW